MCQRLQMLSWTSLKGVEKDSKQAWVDGVSELLLEEVTQVVQFVKPHTFFKAYLYPLPICTNQNCSYILDDKQDIKNISIFLIWSVMGLKQCLGRTSQTSLKSSLSLCFKLKPTPTTWLKMENHSSSAPSLFSCCTSGQSSHHLPIGYIV